MKTPLWLTALLGIGAFGLFVDDLRLRLSNNTLSADLAAAEITVAAEKKRADLAVQRVAGMPPAPPPSRPERGQRPRKKKAEARRPERGEKREALREKLQSMDPEEVEALVEERLAQRHDERRARHEGEMNDKIERFSQQVGLDQRTTDDLGRVMEEAMADLSSLFEARHTRDLSGEEIHQEMGEIRRRVEIDLEAILGSEDAEAFQGSLHGPLSAHDRPRREQPR